MPFDFLQIVVLLVGTNNTNNTAEEVAEGIFEIVKNIREKLPDAYIVLPVMIFSGNFLSMICFSLDCRIYLIRA